MNDDDTIKKQAVYFDGDCPMCRAFVAGAAKTSSDTVFDDFRSGSLPSGIRPEDAERYIHLVDENGRVERGADAILTLIGRRRGLGLISRTLKLPPLIFIARILYRFAANNRMMLFGAHRRLFIVKLLLVFAFFVPAVITRRLWFSEHARFYALTPVSDLLPPIPFPIDYLIFGAMLLLLALIFVTPRARPAIVAFTALTSIYTLWDQSRWMPYTYQFLVMFVLLATITWDPKRDQASGALPDRTLNALSVVLVGIWLWSGLHKFSARYLHVGFPWMMEPFLSILPQALHPLVLAFGLLTPAIEAGGALLVLCRRTRAFGVIVLCLMHSFILLVFGPFGHSFNESVWSWNIAQLSLCICFFWKRQGPSWRDILIGRSALHRIVAFMFVVMPLGNYYGVWDDFLSHALYSWTTKEAEIELKTPAVEAALPDEVRPAVAELNGRRFVHVLNWSYLVFESPPYHAHRVFTQVFGKLCDTVGDRTALELLVYEKPHWRTGRSEIVRYGCGPAGGRPQLLGPSGPPTPAVQGAPGG